MNPTLSLTLALSLTPTLALTLALTLTTDPSPNPHQVEDLRFFVGCIVAPLEPLLSMAERRAIFSSNPNPDPNPSLKTLTLTLTLALTRRAIFSNAQQLLDLHEGILAALTLAQEGSEPQSNPQSDPQSEPKQSESQSEPGVLLARVAGAFAARIPFFKLYAEYCGNYVYAAQKLRAVQETHAEAKQIVTEIEAEHETTVHPLTAP